MTERMVQFLPSILTLMGIAALVYVYLKLVTIYLGEHLKSIAWCKNNKWKVAFLIGTPAANIWAPVSEELIYRVPLIIAFTSVSRNAWWGILASSVIFASSHYFGNKVNLLQIVLAEKNGEIKTDDVEMEGNELQKAQAQDAWKWRLAHVVATLPLGILASYYGIKYQSIWLSVGIHFAWNLVMPIIMPFLGLIVLLICLAIMNIWTRFQWRHSDYNGRR